MLEPNKEAFSSWEVVIGVLPITPSWLCDTAVPGCESQLDV